MKIKLLLLLLFSTSLNLFGQYSNPHVQWSFSAKKIAADQFDLVATAKIDAGFHLYSQFIGEGGPIPTTFTFEKSKDYQLLGKVKESGNRKEEIEPLFENMKLIWFEDKVVFTQRVKIFKQKVGVSGSVNFMTCNDKMCDPPTDQPFEVKWEGMPASTETGSTNEIPKKDSVANAASSAMTDTVPGKDSTSKAAATPPVTDTLATATTPAIISPDDSDVRNMSNWKTFIAGFGYGLIALLMPCVWPVIPLTISFFLKQSREKKNGRMNAILYG